MVATYTPIATAPTKIAVMMAPFLFSLLAISYAATLPKYPHELVVY
jgi:hypothetical protein